MGRHHRRVAQQQQGAAARHRSVGQHDLRQRHGRQSRLGRLPGARLVLSDVHVRRLELRRHHRAERSRRRSDVPLTPATRFPATSSRSATDSICSTAACASIRLFDYKGGYSIDNGTYSFQCGNNPACPGSVESQRVARGSGGGRRVHGEELRRTHRSGISRTVNSGDSASCRRRSTFRRRSRAASARPARR